jgi:hypothetical protein
MYFQDRKSVQSYGVKMTMPLAGKLKICICDFVVCVQIQYQAFKMWDLALGGRFDPRQPVD